jgi:membrane protease YdiL (CAAX protease family)
VKMDGGLRRLLWDGRAVSLRQGRWSAGWTLLGTAAAVVVVILAGFAWILAFDRFAEGASGNPLAWEQARRENASVFLGNPYSLHGFVLIGIVFLLPVLAAALVQGHRASDFLTLYGGFSWRRFWRSGGAMLAATLPFLPLVLFIYGDDPQWSFASLGFPLFLVATVAVIAIQTFAEEAFFRGYLYHAWLRVVPSPALVAIFWSVVFSALHWFNPDVQRDPVPAFAGLMAFALFAQWLTVRTGNLDAAWGFHFVNNVFATLFVNITPGYVTDAPLLQFEDRIYAAGGSAASDPMTYVWLAAAFGLQYLLVVHPRSPFFIAPRPVEPVEASTASSGR